MSSWQEGSFTLRATSERLLILSKSSGRFRHGPRKEGGGVIFGLILWVLLIETESKNVFTLY